MLIGAIMLMQAAAAIPVLGVLPDLQLTPGATDPVVTQETIGTTICVPGYTAKVRHVTQATKRKVLATYRVKHPDWPLCPPKACEVDHLASLELGGSNEATNLWPESYEIPGAPGQGARDKDTVENQLHRAVCSGKIGIREAQDRIIKDWRTAMEGIAP